jgi:hypothetical protein
VLVARINPTWFRSSRRTVGVRNGSLSAVTAHRRRRQVCLRKRTHKRGRRSLLPGRFLSLCGARVTNACCGIAAGLPSENEPHGRPGIPRISRNALQKCRLNARAPSRAKRGRRSCSRVGFPSKTSLGCWVPHPRARRSFGHVVAAGPLRDRAKEAAERRSLRVAAPSELYPAVQDRSTAASRR